MDNIYYIFPLFLIMGLIVLITYNIIRPIIKRQKEKKLLQTVTSLDRGTRSERQLILDLLNQGIPSLTIFHELFVEKYKDNYSQIDVVVATKVGILVFEVKDYGGWIFGKGDQNYWTQMFAYGDEKFRFYNPVMQNKKHIEALKEKLNQCADVPFYSIIVFFGNCTLRDISLIPDRTFIIYPEDVLYTINSILENNPPANYKNKKEVVKILKEAVNNGNNTKIHLKHIQNINRMLLNNKQGISCK